MIKTVIATRDSYANTIIIRDPQRGLIRKLQKDWGQHLGTAANGWWHTAGSLCEMHKKDFKTVFGFTPRKGSKHELFLQSEKVN